MVTKKHGETNYISNKMGIPAHDYVKNTYDVSNQLTLVEYYIGGLQDAGDLVATLSLTYDSIGNLTSVERTQ